MYNLNSKIVASHKGNGGGKPVLQTLQITISLSLLLFTFPSRQTYKKYTSCRLYTAICPN